MNFDNHPCFNPGAHKTFGRVHLPVAPRCNIQCKFCNRKYDCVNESRPGVTSGVLTPHQAMQYLKEVFDRKKNISVVGIAGPGDPFANPDETMETLRLVREQYPDMMLCVATNGLGIEPYLDELAALKVSHITITINAVDPDIAAKIYAWIRYGKRVRRAEEGAGILLEKQLKAVRGLKERGMVVKINTIIIPGINDEHIEEVARTVGEMGVDILNCVPYYPNEGAAFEHIEEPSPELTRSIREKAGQYVPQMSHCTRCRADAVGLLGETPDAVLMEKLKACESGCGEPAVPVSRPPNGQANVAVASMEGVLVNQHLGEAAKLLIYGKKDGVITLLEARDTPARGNGLQRWEEMASLLEDCGTLLVNGIGEKPKKTLSARGIDILEIEGVIEEAVRAVMAGQSIRHLMKRDMTACGAGCSGTGGGCG